MVAHYAGARQHVIEGSDHAISEFPQYVDEVLDVLPGGSRRGEERVRCARPRGTGTSTASAAPAAHARLAGDGRLADRAPDRAQRRVPRAAPAPEQRACAWPTRRSAIGMHRPGRVWEREVLLRCDGVPVVFAHTVVPMSATAADWPLFSALGERSLGSTLFYDPLVTRGELEFARHPRRPSADASARARRSARDGRHCFTMRGAACTAATRHAAGHRGVPACGDQRWRRNKHNEHKSNDESIFRRIRRFQGRHRAVAGRRGLPGRTGQRQAHQGQGQGRAAPVRKAGPERIAGAGQGRSPPTSTSNSCGKSRARKNSASPNWAPNTSAMRRCRSKRPA